MINLLPPDLKEQIRYAKLNRLVLMYLRVTLVVVVVLTGIFAWAINNLAGRTTEKAGEVATDQAQLKEISSSFLPKAKDASDRLNAIKYVQGSKTKFAELISDLTNYIPPGVKIDEMTLTGDDTKPMAISVTGPTYDSILAMRDGLVQSPRIGGVDISAVTQEGGGTSWNGQLVIGFNKGQAK